MSDVPVSPVDPVAAAEAELAKAQADLAAAEQAPPAPMVSPPPEAEESVHLSVSQPWHVFEPGDGLPTVTFRGIYVSGSIAAQILAAAQAQGVVLEQN